MIPTLEQLTEWEKDAENGIFPYEKAVVLALCQAVREQQELISKQETILKEHQKIQEYYDGWIRYTSRPT